MKLFFSLFLLFFLQNTDVFSQEKYKKHTVSKGETISEISDKYGVKSSEIYKLNPDAINGIQWKSILLIPSKQKSKIDFNQSKEKIQNTKRVEVLPKETVYGIAKKTNTTIEVLYQLNPSLEKEGLRIGQSIQIPSNEINPFDSIKKEEKESQKVAVTTDEVNKIAIENKGNQMIFDSAIETIHEIAPKESLYSISKKYDVLIIDLEKANSLAKNQVLKVGQKIKIPTKENSTSNRNELNKPTIKVSEPEKELVTKKKIEVNSGLVSEISHTVLAKETKYGIAKQYGITIAELEIQNPTIQNKLLVGSVLKIKSSKIIEETVSTKIEAIKENTIEINSDVQLTKEHDAEFVSQLIAKASENIGTRYRSGGTTKDGFDCSGLVTYTFANTDIKLPRSSYEMASFGSIIENQEAKKGDLIFFKTNGRNKINHVGMVVEVLDDEIKFIHSTNQRGVIISSTKEPYYEKRVVQINRVF